jgi:serine acetyltransferase
VVIEEDAVLGPGVIVLPNVTIGRGAIVAAGSVVTKSVPPKTMVQGNPARPIAIVEVPLGLDVSVKEFAKGLRSFGPASPRDESKEKGT